MYKKYGRRHEQCMLLSLGTMIDSALKVNVSIGIVAMTNRCDKHASSAPVLPWTPVEQGMVLSVFFLGYIVFQVPSGFLGTRFSTVGLLASSFLATGILTVLAPYAAIHGGYRGLTVVRFFTGLVQGIIYPSMKTMLSRWAVPLERSRFYAAVFGGTSLGAALTMLWGGLLAETWTGWPLLFYSSGLAAILYSALIYILGANSPETHRSINDWERQFMAKSFGADIADEESIPTPWKDILTSGPVWALCFTHAAACWGYWTIMTLTPTYIHEILGIKWSENGYTSAIPSFVNFFLGIFLASLDDKIHKNMTLSKKFSRKFWNTMAFWGTAAALAALSVIKAEAVTALVLLSFATSINGLTNMGFLMNHNDLSPNFAGTIFGLTNSLGNLASVFGPFVSFTVLSDMSLESEWHKVFGLAAVVLFLGNSIFLLFGSTDTQKWNAPKNKYVLVKPPMPDGAHNQENVGRINMKRFSQTDLHFFRRMSTPQALATLDVAELLKKSMSIGETTKPCPYCSSNP